MHRHLPKLIVLLGPTAAGKTSWAIDLAKKFAGEIISADSRQIYKKMNIGTAKEAGTWQKYQEQNSYFVEGVPHYLIDFIDPGKNFTLTDFHDLAIEKINDISKRGKLPMLVGGTGLYISSVVDNWLIPRQAPNTKLRKSLESKKPEELRALLKTIDPASADKVDMKNARRVVRALEVAILTGESFLAQQKKGAQLFNILQIGVDVPREVLYKRVEQRVDEMIERGLLKEIESLINQKYSWDMPSMSGIGYSQMRPYFAGECDLYTAKDNLKRDTRRYARRQMTWFKRDKRIKWCKTMEEAEEMVKKFLI